MQTSSKLLFCPTKTIRRLGLRTYLSVVLISCRPTYRLQQHLAICSSGFPTHLRRTADAFKFARNANRIGANFQHFTGKDGSNRLTGVPCVRRSCSYKFFSSPTTAGLSAKYDSAINIHTRYDGVPGEKRTGRERTKSERKERDLLPALWTNPSRPFHWSSGSLFAAEQVKSRWKIALDVIREDLNSTTLLYAATLPQGFNTNYFA